MQTTLWIDAISGDYEVSAPSGELCFRIFVQEKADKDSVAPRFRARVYRSDIFRLSHLSAQAPEGAIYGDHGLLVEDPMFDLVEISAEAATNALALVAKRILEQLSNIEDE